MPFPALMIIHHRADPAHRPIPVTRVSDAVDVLSRRVVQFDGVALQRAGGARDHIRHSRIFRGKRRRIRGDDQVVADREQGIGREGKTGAQADLPAGQIQIGWAGVEEFDPFLEHVR